MTDFSAYILHTNRPDLTRKAFDSIRDLMPDIAIIDNAGDLEDFPCAIVRPHVPLSATQSINFCLTNGLRLQNEFILWMHNDAEAHPGSALALAERARTESSKWGVLFTNYDSFSAVNLEAVKEIGLWDTFFSGYYSDNDFYRRLRLAGYGTIDTGIPVTHIGSQTINSDPERRFMNSVTFPLYTNYYRSKWGGEPGSETYTRPFNR